MKRLVSLILLAAVLLCAALPASAGMMLANPWTETDAEGIMQTIGVRFGVPKEAGHLLYRMLPDQQLAEMHFSMDGVDYVARIKPASAFEDISGLYYDPWLLTDDCTLKNREARVLLTRDESRIISLCLWYDAAPGLMYSLAAVSSDLTDILGVADQIFLPMQEEADADPTSDSETLAQMLRACTGYAGTAGASLKSAVAAAKMAEYALAVRFAEADPAVLREAVHAACTALDGDQSSELALNLPGIHAHLTAAFTDYESVRDLFDTAGVGETMEPLAAKREGYAHWAALYALLSAELN